MKEFYLTMVVSANSNQTEEGLMQKFEEFIDSAEDVKRILWNGEICLIRLSVEEIHPIDN